VVSEVEVSAGTVEYDDTGGDGPVLVLLHGLTMDSSLWRKVVPELPGSYRCVLPTLPLGGHRRPMRPDADLSLAAMVRLVAEFLDRLDLRDVTLVLNDWGGAQLLISEGRDERIARLVLSSCEAFDNYPPGLPGRAIATAARIPGGLYLTMQALRLRALRRAPGSWGWMSKRPIPDEIMDRWFAPATTNRDIRRDLAKYARSAPGRGTLLEWAQRLRSFDRRVLVAWASEDKVMPPEHGRRLAELFPDARLIEIPDSYTLIPEDQPVVLAHAIKEFVDSTPIASPPPGP
jgi:pimeloyl-ACP methyl ester carboxylesterase